MRLAHGKECLTVVEKELDLGYPFPLRLHSRYNRDQIMAALRLHTFESASSNREGVARQQGLNAEALFITLNKSEKEYSPKVQQCKSANKICK